MVSGHSAQALPARLCLAPACEVEHHVVARGEHGLRMAAATDKFQRPGSQRSEVRPVTHTEHMSGLSLTCLSRVSLSAIDRPA